MRARLLSLLGLLLLAVLPEGCGEGEPTPSPGGPRASYDQQGNLLRGSHAPKDAPNLLLVVIEGLHADDSPFASVVPEGVSFQNAAAPSPWPLPSLASLLTGLMPSGHMLHRDAAQPRLESVFTTFAEVLRNGHGYATAAFVARPPPIEAASLFQGFDHVAGSFVFAATESAVGSWAKDRPRDRPFFLLLETEVGPRTAGSDLEAALGRLRAIGLLENTVLVVTSGHGASADEPAARGRTLDDARIHVPLVIAGPAPFAAARTLPASVGLVDVLPTFLDLVGAPPLDGVEGRSFLDAAHGIGEGRPVLSEERVLPETTGGARNAVLVSVRGRRWKYVVTYEILKGTIIEQAFDLTADPGEKKDLAAGTGRIGRRPFDEGGFCVFVERARDEIWKQTEYTNFMVDKGYWSGVPTVTEERFVRACDEPASNPR